MTARTTARHRSAPVEDGALVRVGVDARWTDDIPPVPGGRTITVSLSPPALVRRDGPSLRALGYRLVGGTGDSDHGAPTAAGAALFLVPRDVVEGHRAWWRALCARADRVYGLAHGPVRVALADALRPHLEAGG